MDVLTSETCWALNNDTIMRHQVGLSLFNYQDDTRSNKHKIIQLAIRWDQQTNASGAHARQHDIWYERRDVTSLTEVLRRIIVNAKSTSQTPPMNRWFTRHLTTIYEVHLCRMTQSNRVRKNFVFAIRFTIIWHSLSYEPVTSRIQA